MTPNKLASNVNKGSESRNVNKVPASADEFDVDDQGEVLGNVQVSRGGSFRVVDEPGVHFPYSIYIYYGEENMTTQVINPPIPSPGKPGYSYKIKHDAPIGCYQVSTTAPPHKINPGNTDNGTLRVGSTPLPDGDGDDRPGRKGNSAHDTERVSST
jgi:hypothetical protein